MPCEPAPPCEPNFPLFCEPLPTTNDGRRLVVEDSASCQKTIPTPLNASVLTTNPAGEIKFATGASSEPINLPALQSQSLPIGELVGRQADGDIVVVTGGPAAPETELVNWDGTNFSKVEISRQFGIGNGVLVRDIAPPSVAQWRAGTFGQVLKTNALGNPEWAAGIGVPSGTTAQRPSPASIGDIFYNTTLSILEWYDGVQWMTSEGTKRSDQVITTFTSSTIFTVPAGITTIAEILIVAGGGSGGGGGLSGGGGAGGVIYTTSLAVAPGSNLTVTIGAGGASAVGASGNAGGNSVFGPLVATGGGGGGAFSGTSAGGNGGSGGGGGANNGPGGSGIVGQGFNGGNSTSTTQGGGGGGATQPGFNGISLAGGAGGNGFTTTITGSVLQVGGGGGGGGSGSAGAGGAGGGGNGGVGAGTAQSGLANTGGGGGGDMSASGAGGSGIVIIKY